jgi:hypothetical protein
LALSIEGDEAFCGDEVTDNEEKAKIFPFSRTHCYNIMNYCKPGSPRTWNVPKGFCSNFAAIPITIGY